MSKQNRMTIDRIESFHLHVVSVFCCYCCSFHILYESRMIEVGFVENEILDLNKSIKWEIIYIHIICCLVCVRFSIFSGINFKYLILILFNKCFYKDLTDFGFGFYYIIFYYCFQNGIEQIVVTINVSFLFH